MRILANVSPMYRSQLNSIQLVLLCRSPHIKKGGFSHILHPLIHDLKILENEGILVETPDGQVCLKGSVVVGDNLGSHSLGGFLENFNSHTFCRFCCSTKEAVQTMFDSNEAQLGTDTGHNHQVEIVKEDPEASSLYGVKTDCPLHALSHFHVINGLPSDIAHDIFEGVAVDVLHNIIVYCVSSEFGTVAYILIKGCQNFLLWAQIYPTNLAFCLFLQQNYM